ncbi:MAG: aminotransferase class I/II-fold pyridoxal phosphate-dependent enzyme [Lachnospiraceae bacterium]|nr:aminotransferase class I/II-fold pyridoxal phosphate-dependent enzyme [Lachnospiraceae bacterium]
MKRYEEMTQEELKREKDALEREYKDYQAKGLKLNMARGKPSEEQLNLSLPMMDVMYSMAKLSADDGTDCRNYGELEGIFEARALMAEIMDTTPDRVICFGNSSLNVMYDMISRAYTHGICGDTPWGKLPEVKFLCPVPGYDRHFAITEFFGIKMINVPMKTTGPDMDMVEGLVASDPAIKGIWCVPKFSNPEGIVYSDETVRRFARLKPAAKDFRIFWDNAYSVHYLYEDDQPQIPDLVRECEEAGNPDIVYKFASTSKITFPGSGISAMAVSKRNRDSIINMMKIQTIGPDKVNQLRHVRFLKNREGVAEQMRRHANILRPKFEMVENILNEELISRGIGNFFSPKGGYFIAFNAPEGTAKRIVGLAKDCGVTMTGAGAPFPYGKDPKDSVIRIAPSYPPIDELEQAAKIFQICARIATAEKLLENA